MYHYIIHAKIDASIGKIIELEGIIPRFYMKLIYLIYLNTLFVPKY